MRTRVDEDIDPAFVSTDALEQCGNLLILAVVAHHGNTPPAEDEQRYYAMLDDLPMAA